MLLPNVPAMYEMQFGVPMSGAILNNINTRLDARTVSVLLHHSGSKLVFVDPASLQLIEDALSEAEEEFEAATAAEEEAPEQEEALDSEPDTEDADESDAPEDDSGESPDEESGNGESYAPYTIEE